MMLIGTYTILIGNFKILISPSLECSNSTLPKKRVAPRGTRLPPRPSLGLILVPVALKFGPELRFGSDCARRSLFKGAWGTSWGPPWASGHCSGRRVIAPGVGSLLQGALQEGALQEGTLQEGTLQEGTLLEGVLLEGALLEGTLLEGALQEAALQETLLQETLMAAGQP